MTPDGYAAPLVLEEVVSLLAGSPGARVLAGGHSLLVEPIRSRLAGSLLVDLRRIKTLVGIEPYPDGCIAVGAMTTLAAIDESAVVRRHHSCLAEAAHLAADAQARNRATLGGALASADPEADLPALALALDAKIQVTGLTGARTMPASALFTGAFQTSLRADEIITGVVFAPVPPRSGTAYEKFRHPATHGALCGVAAVVTLGQKGTIASARLAATGVADHAVRLDAAEKALFKQSARAAGGGALAAARDGITFRGDRFGSAEYRSHLLGVLAERALKRALERAAQS
jgi:aerobic carbon-monoxide dehydrogenase medium subunit